MKTNLIFIILCFANFVSAQNHRFIYDVEFKKDSTSLLTSKENYHLDISSDHATYYSRDYFLADSLIVSNIPFPKTMQLDTSPIFTHIIGTDEFQEYALLESTVLQLQSNDKQVWKLSNEKKNIKTLSLQKAETEWGGRKWTAWFAKDIPFQEGPFKFHGLPGLIVELYDDESNYRFELVRSENLKLVPENQFLMMAKQMSVPVTFEKYKKSKLKYYESPINFIKNANGSSKNNSFYLNDGTVVNAENSREINFRLQQNIKKYNNPIDLKNAIIYP